VTDPTWGPPATPPVVPPSAPANAPLQAPVPGWYPDPWGRAAWRWWDGYAWTWITQPPDHSLQALPVDRRFVGVAEPPEGRWGLGDVAIMFGITAATIAMLIVVVVALASAAGPDRVDANAPLGVDLGSTANAWATIVSLILPWLGLAGWPLIVGRWKGPGWRASFGFAPRWSTLGWGALGGVATFAAIVVGSVVVATLVGQTPDSAAADAALQIKDVPVAYALMLLLIAFGAPFVEELAFRGLFWGAIVKRWGRPWVATIVTGVVFGLFHLEPVRLLGLVGGGIVLGFVRHQKGLAASMVSHACLNSVAALALLLS
jgi:membrane protease YdiL (CAAX protease family)